jgi:hypothetical protein
VIPEMLAETLIIALCLLNVADAVIFSPCFSSLLHGGGRTLLASEKHTTLSGGSTSKPKVALTREASKNHHLYDLIVQSQLPCEPVVLPVICHSSRLHNTSCFDAFLKSLAAADVVALTSPQVRAAGNMLVCNE